MAYDMTAEALTPPVTQQERFGSTRELREWLEPSETVVNQTGLALFNTRLFIDQVNRDLHTPITIDEIPTEEWAKRLKNHDIVWFMGIYEPSEASRQHSLKWAHELRYAKQDLDPERDVAASPFAIPAYEPNPLIAPNWDAWDEMVGKLHALNKKVFVDFVPNHVALDHPWASEHPEYFIQGSEEQYAAHPSLYQPVEASDGQKYLLAHGKDPNFPEWADTLQLNYANPAVLEEMEKILFKLAEHSDGVRCDMAMLLNADTFLRTWGDHLDDTGKEYIRQNNFWERAVASVKNHARQLGKEDFSFVAEAYWDREELGRNFDYIYAKDFYDHLRKIIVDGEEPGQNLINHIKHLMRTPEEGQNYRDVLFTENHDEPRAVSVFGTEPSKAAAALTGLIPGSIFLLNQGQEEGRRIRPPMQIASFPEETPDLEMVSFYERLLMLKRSKLFQQGNWELANISTQSDHIVALQVSLDPGRFSDESGQDLGAIICVNLGHTTVNCRLPDIESGDEASVYRLTQDDFVSSPDTQRDGGMFVELIPWETQVVFYKK